MRIEDAACRAEGFVNPCFVDIATGESMRFDQRHNLLSYMSAEAMAAAFGGDTSYVPSRVGFVYGSEQSEWIGGVITRDQSWDRLKEELASQGADVQVVGFSYSPSLGGEKPNGESSSSGTDGGDGDYDHIKSGGANAITFHAVSNSSDAGEASGTQFAAQSFIYQAVLLGFHGGEYYVISRVSLDDGGIFRRKPDGFEVALDWTVVFH